MLGVKNRSTLVILAVGILIITISGFWAVDVARSDSVTQRNAMLSQRLTDDDLVGYYRFDELSAADESAYGNNGVIYGTPTVVDGMVGKALRFGIGDHIVVPNSSSLSFADNFTISTWFRLTASNPGVQSVFGKSYDRTGIGTWLFPEPSENISISLYNGRCCGSLSEAVYVPRQYKINEWILLSVTHDNNKLKIYVNGQLEAELAASDFNLNQNMANMPLFIGRDSYYRFVGDVDDFRIYNRALGVEEIAYQYCKDIGADTEKPPIMLVTGWGGSEPSLLEDEQLRFFDGYLHDAGYHYGCNLFYAKATSPYFSLRKNGENIWSELCRAHLLVKQWNPSFDGHFDIIAHSYGGLRSRAYLENEHLYGKPCGASEIVAIDNLFMMGTPNGGEPYPLGMPGTLLPYAIWIGGGAVFGGELPALYEMLPPVRLVQNARSAQPTGTCYRLITGDWRGQIVRAQAGLITNWLLDVGQETLLTANDLAVHRDSVTSLLLNGNNYPHLDIIPTDDAHGYADVPLLRDLNSYVEPVNSFDDNIKGRIGLTDCPTTRATTADAVSALELVNTLQAPTTIGGVATIEVASGVIADGEVLTGTFALDEAGRTRILLTYPAGKLQFSLTDPNGYQVNPVSANQHPEQDYALLNTGFGITAGYLLSSTITGTWGYALTGELAASAVSYQVIVLPPTPIAIGLSLPQAIGNRETLVVSATVAYSETALLAGATVTATIARPDGGEDLVTLLDDGTSGDGAAGDGVYSASYGSTQVGGLYGVSVRANGQYAGEPYVRTAAAVVAVSPDTAALTDDYTDAGEDTNGDGLFEALIVSGTVDVGTPATLTLSAELYADNTYIGHARTTEWLAAGSWDIGLRFRAADLISVGLDGPYTLRNVLLVDETETTLLVEAADYVYTTAAYRVEAFAEPVPTAIVERGVMISRSPTVMIVVLIMLCALGSSVVVRRM